MCVCIYVEFVSHALQVHSEKRAEPEDIVHSTTMNSRPEILSLSLEEHPQLPRENACSSSSKIDPLLDAAPLAHIEYLEAEVSRLQKPKQATFAHFSVGYIKHDDNLVQFYTGFLLYTLLTLF